MAGLFSPGAPLSLPTTPSSTMPPLLAVPSLLTRPAQSSPPPVSLANDTFFGDMATAYLGDLGSGGAVTNLGSIVSATQDTFSGDSAASGRGAIFRNEGSVILSNSILDEPEGILSCDGAVEDGGYNVETDDSCGLGPTDNPPSLFDATGIDLSNSAGAQWLKRARDSRYSSRQPGLRRSPGQRMHPHQRRTWVASPRSGGRQLRRRGVRVLAVDR